jgi:hypothetical protein
MRKFDIHTGHYITINEADDAQGAENGTEQNGAQADSDNKSVQ